MKSDQEFIEGIYKKAELYRAMEEQEGQVWNKRNRNTAQRRRYLKTAGLVAAGVMLGAVLVYTKEIRLNQSIPEATPDVGLVNYRMERGIEGQNQEKILVLGSITEVYEKDGAVIIEIFVEKSEDSKAVGEKIILTVPSTSLEELKLSKDQEIVTALSIDPENGNYEVENWKSDIYLSNGDTSEKGLYESWSGEIIEEIIEKN